MEKISEIKKPKGDRRISHIINNTGYFVDDDNNIFGLINLKLIK